MRQEIVDWIMKNSNVRQSPITRDTLLIADADSKVKSSLPKLLLECSMRQLQNDLIDSQKDFYIKQIEKLAYYRSYYSSPMTVTQRATSFHYW